MDREETAAIANEAHGVFSRSKTDPESRCWLQSSLWIFALPTFSSLAAMAFDELCESFQLLPNEIARGVVC